MEIMVWQDFVVYGFGLVGVLAVAKFLVAQVGWMLETGKHGAWSVLASELGETQGRVLSAEEKITLLCEDVGKLKGLINIEPVAGVTGGVFYVDEGTGHMNIEGTPTPKKKRGRPRGSKSKLN